MPPVDPTIQKAADLYREVVTQRALANRLIEDAEKLGVVVKGKEGKDLIEAIDTTLSEAKKELEALQQQSDEIIARVQAILDEIER